MADADQHALPPEPEQDPPHPAPNNRMFAGARVYRWQMYADPALMYLNLINWIIARLEERAAQDGLEATETHQFEGQEYTYRLTARSGFFIILVVPPVDYTDNGQDLALAFSFKDLYLLGFLDAGLWRLFDDADLNGTGDQPNGPAHTKIGFQGGYSGNVFTETMLSLTTLVQSYETLKDTGRRENREIRTALLVFIFVISEGLRFMEWKNHLHLLFQDGGRQEAPDSGGRIFSFLFQD
ncbi:hypothetical protein EJB05_54946, partial [Eragrostis curvula]